MSPHSTRPSNEDGQIAILAAVVLGLGLLAVLGLAIGARFFVERATASSAADSIALATAADPDAGQIVAVELGVDAVIRDGGHVEVVVGDVSASARATQESSVDVAPVLVAVVARAEQLLGVELTPRWVQPRAVRVDGAHHDAFAAIAADLGLCADLDQSFVLC